MNKKVNTVLFVLGATLLNIVLMLVLMTVGLAVISAVAGNAISEQTASIAFMVIFVGSIGGAFFIYHRLVKLISRKIDLNTYFHPIFGRRK